MGGMNSRVQTGKAEVPLNAPGDRMIHDPVSSISILLYILSHVSLSQNFKKTHLTFWELFEGMDRNLCISINKTKPTGKQLSPRLEYKGALI